MKSSIIRLLKQLFATASAAHQNRRPLQQMLEAQWRENSRRAFLKKHARTAMVAGMAPDALMRSLALPNAKSNARIAIIGAGIAGLTAAYYLGERGIKARIFEASARAGGRVLSKNIFGHGELTTEIGAEFIDTGHRDLLRLIRKLGLGQDLSDMDTDDLGEKEVAFINGRHYHSSEMTEEIYHFYPEMTRIKRELSRGNTAYYDNLSLAEFLHKMPLSDWMLKILEAGFVAENGAEAAEQSAAIMLGTLDFDKKHFRMYGDSDERFKIRGGNSRIIAGLTERVGAGILFEHKLLEIRKKSGNEITLTFDQSGTTRQYTFDYVIVTVPFTMLRETELRFGMSPEKSRVIRELGYGANTKFVTETLGSPWRQAGYRGYLYSDTIPNGWDSSQLQNSQSRHSTYTCYLGGRQALDAAPGQETRLAAELGSVLNNAFPGFREAATGRTELAYWPGHPLVKGSYSYYKPGQYSSFGRIAAESVGNILFAGEHTSSAWWGFMNGAVETGRKAAEDVIWQIKR
ncbi:MAG: flavin monoamine oxidase family protein [Bacteroidota bacterium]